MTVTCVWTMIRDGETAWSQIHKHLVVTPTLGCWTNDQVLADSQIYNSATMPERNERDLTRTIQKSVSGWKNSCLVCWVCSDSLGLSVNVLHTQTTSSLSSRKVIPETATLHLFYGQYSVFIKPVSECRPTPVLLLQQEMTVVAVAAVTTGTLKHV